MGSTRTTVRDGVRLCYELRGRPLRWRPWLVLLTGVGFDRGSWAPVAGALGRRFRLVLVDNRGSGASDAPPGPYRVPDLARDVVAVLDDAGIRRAHVVGASLGGMIAQELAIDHPERVDRLVLVSTTPGWPFGYPFPAANTLLAAEAVGRPAAEVARRRAEHALGTTTAAQRPDLVDQLARYEHGRPAAGTGRRQQANAGAVYSNRGRDTRIGARTLVLHGAEDAVVDPRNAETLARCIPDAELVVMPEVGHLPFWERPEAFADTVGTFLRHGTTRPAPDRRTLRARAALLLRRLGRAAALFRGRRPPRP